MKNSVLTIKDVTTCLFRNCNYILQNNTNVTNALFLDKSDSKPFKNSKHIVLHGLKSNYLKFSAF